MALIFLGQSICKICGRTICQGDRYIATPHFIGDTNDRLWQFSDAGLHYDCFQSWFLRQEFVDKFNTVIKQYAFRAEDGTRPCMLDDGTIQRISVDA